MRLITLSTLLTLLIVGCGDSSSSSGGSGGTAGTAGSGGGTRDFTAMLSHTYDPIMIDVGQEVSNVCQTWVLNNDEPVYVTKVQQSNDGGWHHSNWFFVPDTAYKPNYDKEEPGTPQEGTWACRDRSFREYLAAAAGGVFFAQSTQTLQELQEFPDGAALEIPPHSMIVGSVHLLNVSASAMNSAMTMDVETVPADQVDIRLTPFSFANGNLNIPAAVDGVPTESRTSMLCDLREPFQEHLGTDEVDYNIYYVLGHYHQWGNFFNLSFVHEDGRQQTVFEIDNRIGEPIGSIIDPPMNNAGAAMLRAECGFINNTDRTLHRGLEEGEMCDFLAYTDSNLKMGAGGGANHEMGQNEEGLLLFETDCGPITGFKAY